MGNYALLVGLATLDLIYLADSPPKANEKLVAQDSLVAAGGPATNAAIACRALGQEALVAAAVGKHPLAQLILSDLKAQQVAIADLSPNRTEAPPVSSIVVTASTGERAVISRNAINAQAGSDALSPEVLDRATIVLIDGHQMAVGATIAKQAKARGIPVAIDGGSWKPGFETVLPFVDYAICSANFYPPHCQHPEAVIANLRGCGIPDIAITNGSAPILYWSQDKMGEIAVPVVPVKDTLGAGDIFHGAFCYFILQLPFVEALREAAKVASRACEFFGTRQWQQEIPDSSDGRSQQ